MLRPIPDICVTFLRDPEIENCILHPYLDQKKVWTIGIGHRILPTEHYQYNCSFPATPPILSDWTIYSHPPADSRAWVQITDEQAVNTCKTDLTLAATTVCGEVKNLVGLNDNQYAALIIFTFNIGVYAFSTSGCLAALNTGNMTEFFNRWSQWNKVTDEVTKKLVVSNGLVKRRKLEQLLYLKAV